MDNYRLVDLLKDETQNLVIDTKAESQVALALEKGISIDDLLISCDSLFFREYKKDILFTEIRDARKLPVIHYHLTRSGIYDHLPEGLFFQPVEDSATASSASDMAANYKANKQKELDIRRFFTPIENELFIQRIQVEKEEIRLLEGLTSGILNDYFICFWNFSDSIPGSFIVPLILLLPYANQIAGDIGYTSDCLEHLLQEKIEIRKRSYVEANASTLMTPRLGDLKLGINSVCGDEFMEEEHLFQCIIGPLTGSKIQDYLEGGTRFTLLQTFYKFFIPAGVDMITTFNIPINDRITRLKVNDDDVLGYTTFL